MLDTVLSTSHKYALETLHQVEWTVARQVIFSVAE